METILNKGDYCVIYLNGVKYKIHIIMDSIWIQKLFLEEEKKYDIAPMEISKMDGDIALIK